MSEAAPSSGHDLSELVVVANRLPVQRVGEEWQTSPGGLVRAMLGVLTGRQGAWVGWTGEISDDESESASDLTTGAGELHDLDGVELVSVPLSQDDFEQYYERISNGALWPLFHDAIRSSNFDGDSWAVYREVNARFSAAAARAAAPGATVWIHDYHLLLVPSMLRALRADISIGFFLHIPFPPQELFMRMPWRDEMIDGMLGADLLGFQRRGGADNFIALAKRLAGAEAAERDPEILRLDDGRMVQVGTFPISIDTAEFAAISGAPHMAEAVAEIRHRLGDPTTVLLGVDRLDYTKGIDLRLASFGALLRSRAESDPATMPDAEPDAKPDVVLVQIAVPGREGVESYVEERETVEQLVGEVNGEHAAIGYPAVHYIRRGLPLEALIPLYAAADVMLVTPRRDGMNLVAKEFVASRRDDTGVLILSEFAGAADELTDAVIVNPHDPDAVQLAMEQALAMPADEIARRMASMRRVVAEHDVHAWARQFLGRLVAASIAHRPGPWLIGVDVDGTLAPIVTHPDDAAMAPGAIETLVALNSIDDVTVVVVSGRPMVDLRDRFGIPADIAAFGSHGAESSFDSGLSPDRTDHETNALASAEEVLITGVEQLPGAWIEHKPFAVALHVRQADQITSPVVLAELAARLGASPSFTVHVGHQVLEVAVRSTSKVHAFGSFRERLGSTTAVFIGDDASDERVFRSLVGGDVSVKVGPGSSVAKHRLDGPADVVALLATLTSAIASQGRGEG